MSLEAEVIERSLDIEAAGEESLSRVVINGAVVIYDPFDPPHWLTPILDARDENGDVPEFSDELVSVCASAVAIHAPQNLYDQIRTILGRAAKYERERG